MKRALFLFALAGGAGFTQCDAYHQVVVPVVDTTPPAINNLGYRLDTGYEFFAAPYRLASPDDHIIALASAMDEGGVKRITVDWWLDQSCCKGNVCSLEQPLSAGGPYPPDEEETQAGGPGATVSNGIWRAKGVKPRDLAPCAPDEYLGYFYFGWKTTAEDFAGNRAETWSQPIYYSAW